MEQEEVSSAARPTCDRSESVRLLGGVQVRQIVCTMLLAHLLGAVLDDSDDIALVRRCWRRAFLPLRGVPEHLL